MVLDHRDLLIEEKTGRLGRRPWLQACRAAVLLIGPLAAVLACQMISLQSGGERSAILENVVIRSGRGHDMEVHVDTDEANAMAMENGEMLEVLR